MLINFTNVHVARSSGLIKIRKNFLYALQTNLQINPTITKAQNNF